MFKEQSVANNVDMVMYKGAMTKWPVQKQTPRTARSTQNSET